MQASLFQRLEKFLAALPGSESIDAIGGRSTDPGKRADFFLGDRKVVAEIKTLTQGQEHKGEAVVDGYLAETKARIFGTLPLSRIAKEPEHLSSLEETIFRRMTRGIEKICSSANRQIGAEFSRLPHLSTGLLVILNEDLADMHPRLVADRVLEFARAKPTNLHYCLLVFESHKVRVGNTLAPYPLLLDLAYSARQRRAGPFLKSIQQAWAKQNGHPGGLPDPEPREIEFHPDSITFGR